MRMDLSKKQQLYKTLIEHLKEDYKKRSLQRETNKNPKGQKKPVVVESCDYLGNQINLWSYWQGSLNAKVLLVGQDWGTVNPKSDSDKYRNERTRENVQKMDRGEPAGYFDGIDDKIRFKTDTFIIELFKELGNKYNDLINYIIEKNENDTIIVSEINRSVGEQVLQKIIEIRKINIK